MMTSPSVQVSPEETDFSFIEEAITVSAEDISPVEFFLDTLYEDIQTLGQQNAQVRIICREALSDENIDKMVVLTADGLDGVSPINRRESRAVNRYKRQLRESVETIIQHARFFAQGSVWHADTDFFAETDRQYHLYKEDAERTDGDPKLIASELWVKTFEAEQESARTEKLLQEKIDDFLGQDPANIVQLLDHLESEDTDPDQHRPLLIFLAKKLFDPMSTKLIENHLAMLGNTLEHYIPIFCHEMDRLFDTEQQDELDEKPISVLPTDQEWLRFIQTTLLAQNDNKLSIAEIFQSIPIENWPESLQETFGNEYVAFLDEILVRYKALLAPHRDNRTFFIHPNKFATRLESEIATGAIVRSDSAGNQRRQSQQSKKQKGRKGGSRVTASTLKSLEAVENTEPTSPHFTHVDHLAKSETGYVLDDRLDLEKLSTPDGISIGALIDSIPEIKGYLADYDHETRLVQDMEQMVASILNEPYGNGATKLTNVKIKFREDSGRVRALSVWHLNPVHRSELPVGDVARQTRIYYTVCSDRDAGTRSLVILKVDHKNSAEKLRGAITY